MDDIKFAYFKKKVLEHLESLENEEIGGVRKSFSALLEVDCIAKGRAANIGEIRSWKGGARYKKIAQNKWVRVYDKDSSSAKRSIGQIKAMARKCTTSEELLQLVLKYKERFSDENGHPIPLVQELNDYVSKRNDEIEGGKTQKKEKLKPLSKQELHDFIQEHKNSKENVRVSLGDITEEAKKRIKDKTDFEVNRIILDSGDMRHALKKENHWIKPEDFEKIPEIVNNTNTIIKQDKLHQNNETAIFVEEIENGINLVMEFRSRKGDLALVTAYRQKKERADAPIEKTPGQTSETLHTSISSIPQSEKKSRENILDYTDAEFIAYSKKLFSGDDGAKKQKEDFLKNGGDAWELAKKHNDIIDRYSKDPDKYLGKELANIGRVYDRTVNEIPERVLKQGALSVDACGFLCFGKVDKTYWEGIRQQGLQDVNSQKIVKTGKDIFIETLAKEIKKKNISLVAAKKVLQSGITKESYGEKTLEQSDLYKELLDLLPSNLKKSLPWCYFKKDDNGGIRFYIKKSIPSSIVKSLGAK